MIISLFSLIQNKKLILFSIIVSVFLICGNTNVADLLVDTLLPATALSLIVFCIKEKDRIQEKYIYLIPGFCYLVSIKTSGILLSVFVLIMMGSICKSKNNIKIIIILFSVSLITFYLWIKHVDMVFMSAETSKFSLSVNNMRSVFEGKSWTDIISIIHTFVSQVLNIHNRAIYLGFLLMPILVYGLYRKNSLILKLSGFSVLIYIFWQLGTLGMYIFSMPIGEALTIDGYERYHATIFVFAGGIIISCYLLLLNNLLLDQNGLLKSLCVCSAFVLIWFFSHISNFNYLKRRQYEGTIREKYDQLVEKWGIQEGKNCLVVVADNDENQGYVSYMTRYLLYPKSYNCVQLKDAIIKNDTQLQQYDYIITFGDDNNLLQFMQEKFGNYSEVVIQVR